MPAVCSALEKVGGAVTYGIFVPLL